MESPYRAALLAALKAIEAAKALHPRADYGTYCETCSSDMHYVDSPCPTLLALEG
jgi:hypothetical protein